MFSGFKEKWEKTNVVSFIILSMTIISGIFSVFTYSLGYNYYDGFDYLEGVYWAKATLVAKSIINPNYNYCYFLPFGSNLLMAPFVSAFGVSLISNQLGMLLFFVIYIFAISYLSSSLFDSLKEQVYFISIVTMFVYTLVGDSLLHHILSYGIGFVCLLGEIGSIIKIYKRRAIRDYAIMVICSFWSALNGLGSVALSSLAIIISLFLYAYIKDIEISWNSIKQYKAVFLIIICVLIGYLGFKHLNSLTMARANYDGRFIFCDKTSIVKKISEGFLNDLLVIFSISPEGIPFFSSRGMFNFVKLGFIMCLFIVAFLYIFKFKNKNDIELFVLLDSLVVIAICVLQYIFSASSCERFLFNSILSLFLIAGLGFVRCFTKPKDILLSRFTLFLLVSVLTIGQLTQRYPRGQEIIRQKELIINDLKNENLSFGYSTSFEYARQLSVLSKEEQEVILALYSDNDQKFIVESLHTFPYEREKPQGIDRFYIIIPDDELDYFASKYEQYEKIVNKRIKEIQEENCKILVFDLKDFDSILEFE